jgi:hypothetical protein
MLPKPDLEKLPEEIIERLPKKLPKIEKLEDVPRYLESQGLLLDDLNVRMQTLLELTQTMLSRMERVPEGLTFPIELTVTGNTITKYEIEKEPDAGSRPWNSASIYNDGPDTVEFRANTPVGRFQTIQEGEGADLDFHAPLLKKLFFRCQSPTASTALRILGEA